MMIDERLREDGEAFVFVDVNDALQKNLAISCQLSKVGNIWDLVQRQRVPALPFLPSSESWQFISSSLVPKPRTDKQRKEHLVVASSRTSTKPHPLISLISTRFLHTISLTIHNESKQQPGR
jgi:hypothetical protein